MNTMSNTAFVRAETLPQIAPPSSVRGPMAWIRENLFASPTHTILTLIALYLIYTTVPEMIRFYLIDAVWTGKDRDACLEAKVGHPVGACWAYIADRWRYFVYGSYPVEQRWRVNICFVAFAFGVAWMLWQRAPYKAIGALFFFVVMPLGAYGLLSGNSPFALFGAPVVYFAEPGNSLQKFIADAVALQWAPWRALLAFGLFLAAGHFVAGVLRIGGAKQWLIAAAVAIVITLFGYLGSKTWNSMSLPKVDTGLWGGITVTFLVAAVGIVFSLPLGVVLALGRRSRLPIIRVFSVIFIEFVRGVPLITVLFMANTMLPLFVPQEYSPDRLLRPLIGVALFAAAYMAEVIRGGLQAMPKGQYEGAMSLGLGYWKMMRLIILPQALRIVIPGIVNTFIGLFKDTTLVAIVGMFDFLRTIEATLVDPTWATPTTRATGYGFAAIFYFLCCWGMSRYSISIEQRLAAGHKR
jgi:general L-amino acid transport system permease protein